MTVLNRFPARIRIANPDGTPTVEFLRMLDVLVERSGDAFGDMGADVFATLDAPGEAASADLVQPAGHTVPEPEPITQQHPAESAPPEMLMQPLPQQITADQVEGLGTIATQNVGTNYSGSFTGKTVTVSNGIITSVT